MSTYGTTTGTMSHCSIMAPYGDIDLWSIHGEQLIHVNASLMEISFCYRRIFFFFKVITVKFCAWHDNCTDVECVKFCSDMVPNDGVTPYTTTKNFPSNLSHDVKSFTGVMGDHNIHYSTNLFQVTQILEFLSFSKTLLQSCRKINYYYLLLNTKKANQKAGLRCSV